MIMEIGKLSLQVNELRIGNYVYNTSTFSKGVCRIAGIYKEGLIKLEEDDKTYEKFIYPELIPIPLTEEILLDCGFKEVSFSKGQYEYENGFCLSFMFENGRIYENSDICNCSREFSFLHEVQNYIFAKTGKELEVKL